MATNYDVILTIIHSSSNKSALEIHNELTIQGKLGIFSRGTNTEQVKHDLKKRSESGQNIPAPNVLCQK